MFKDMFLLRSFKQLAEKYVLVWAPEFFKIFQ